jgi:hypothetical protein
MSPAGFEPTTSAGAEPLRWDRRLTATVTSILCFDWPSIRIYVMDYKHELRICYHRNTATELVLKSN